MLTVTDVQADLKIGRRQAYEVVNRPDFPKIRIGVAIRVPEEAYAAWKLAQIEQKAV